MGGGCRAKYQRRVLKDTENKKIIYEIVAAYEDQCAMVVESRNWVIIPKIPDNYIIEFRLK